MSELKWYEYRPVITVVDAMQVGACKNGICKWLLRENGGQIIAESAEYAHEPLAQEAMGNSPDDLCWFQGCRPNEQPEYGLNRLPSSKFTGCSHTYAPYGMYAHRATSDGLGRDMDRNEDLFCAFSQVDHYGSRSFRKHGSPYPSRMIISGISGGYGSSWWYDDCPV